MFFAFPTDEREAVQKKTFTKWVNSHLARVSCRITDLYTDLRDGRMLIKLLEVLSGERLVSAYQCPLWGVGVGWGFVNPWLRCSMGNLIAEGSALKMSFYTLKKKKSAPLLQLDPDTIKMPSCWLQWESKEVFFRSYLLVTC